jgi:Flp pilus assembly protein TadG
MFRKFKSRNPKNHGGGMRALRAQAIVEFAIALPVLMMLLIGIMEVGRLLLMYSLVVNASRDAVRYASAVGLDDAGYPKYIYCDGITNTAENSAYFVSLDTVEISYDDGPGTGSIGVCGAVTEDDLESGDRVTVTVEATYNPILTLLPIPPRIISATSSRTILGIFKLGN